jgi:hypothetical protein
MWKRNTAGILDFVLATTVFGLLLYQLFPDIKVTHVNGATQTVYGIGPWATVLLLVLVIAYFIILGRTGGTVFQRLFGMRRAG